MSRATICAKCAKVYYATDTEVADSGTCAACRRRETGPFKAADFDDAFIDDVRTGRLQLTAAEREYLVTDTTRFEECSHTEAELRAMTDAELIWAAYWVWADYASGKI